MKSANWNLIIIILGFAVVIGSMIQSHVDRKNDRVLLDSLMMENRKVLSLDSIRSANDARILDTLRAIRVELDRERMAQHRETLKIRREKQKIAHRIDSIGPIVRPDF